MDASQYTLQDLASKISLTQDPILTLPRTHPLRVFCVQSQGMVRFGCYTMTKNLDDLNQSIFRLTEAILLPQPCPLPWDERRINIVEILYCLSASLLRRAHHFKQPKDVKRSIIHLRYLRYLHGQPLEDLYVPPGHVTALLVDALWLQVELKLGDTRQSIEEMAILCLELLRSDMSTDSITDLIIRFAQTAETQFGGLPERPEPSEKVIECLRETNARLPDSLEVSIAFAWSLSERFRVSFSSGGYKDGVTTLDKVIRAPGDRPTERQEAALNVATTITLTRTLVFRFRKPEYLEEAIYRASLSALPGDAPLKDTHRHGFKGGLAALRVKRFDDPSVASGLQEARTGYSNRQLLRDLTGSFTELNGKNKDKHICVLLSAGLDFHRIPDDKPDEAEIERALNACSPLGTTFLRAFLRTEKIEYLNQCTIGEPVTVTRAVHWY